MAYPRPISCREIIEFTDAQLDQYLDEHGPGPKILKISDVESITQEVVQRLRDRAEARANPSKQMDLDQVTSRLLATPSRPRCLSPNFVSSGETTPTLPPTESFEREYHCELIKDGGRPCYSIDIIDEAAQDPFTFLDIMRPWLTQTPTKGLRGRFENWNTFQKQFEDWQRFRQWQAHNREIKVPTPINPTDNCLRALRGEPKHREPDPTQPPHIWHEQQAPKSSHEHRFFLREFGGPETTYTNRLTKLLAKYGFTRTFELLDDPASQDKLTEWIEYLGYQYAKLRAVQNSLANRQTKHDEAWEKLVNSGVLSNGETEDTVWGDLYMERGWADFQLTIAENIARSKLNEALEWSEQDLNGSQGPRSSSESRKGKVLQAQSELDKAIAAREPWKRWLRCVADFHKATYNYHQFKVKEAIFDPRATWVRDQIPLIEAELSGSLGPRAHALGSDTTSEPDGLPDSPTLAVQASILRNNKRPVTHAVPNIGEDSGAALTKKRRLSGADSALSRGPESQKRNRQANSSKADLESSASRPPQEPVLASPRAHSSACGTKPIKEVPSHLESKNAAVPTHKAGPSRRESSRPYPTGAKSTQIRRGSRWSRRNAGLPPEIEWTDSHSSRPVRQVKTPRSRWSRRGAGMPPEIEPTDSQPSRPAARSRGVGATKKK
ncbi:unnamed protein product [Clonostachys rosea]|uniref:Uncharacterized protein n=1 Tax=Bionectria ochroleuca TaxID=29856 RepID=A0ABY6U2K7_BIOOC|nr:unnamed protein product [Clonostachys rosea]